MARKNELEITEVRVYPSPKEGNLIAMASVTFNAEFCVTGISVREGKNGRFVSFPSRKTADGEYKDICFPLSKETRTYIQEEIMNTVDESIIEHPRRAYGPAEIEELIMEHPAGPMVQQKLRN